MSKTKKFLTLLFVGCALVTLIGVLGLGGIQEEDIEAWLAAAGIWAPIVYILAYTVATLVFLPSTPLNLAGGAIFGGVLGTVWTSLAAVIAAVVAFAFTRTVGRDFVAQKLSGKWEVIDREVEQGGIFYIFAIRLIPILPYGLVNYAAGLTKIQFRDYFIATLPGTVIGVFPFVILGASFQSLSQGRIIPFVAAIGLVGVFILLATIYRQRKKRL